MKPTIVVMSVDRSDPVVVRINTAVDLLHCPIAIPKSLLKSMGYSVFRPKPLTPMIHAVIERHIARHGGKMPLGGITVEEDDREDLPINPESAD